LKVPFRVIQAEGADVIIGDEYGSDFLVLTYHRHAYSLGEHYNAAVAIEKND
jgi:OTU domain-containing protein 6